MNGSNFIPVLIECNIELRSTISGRTAFPFNFMWTYKGDLPEWDYLIEVEMTLLDEKEIPPMECSHLKRLFKPSLPLYLWQKDKVVQEDSFMFYADYNATTGDYSVKVRFINADNMSPIGIMIDDDINIVQEIDLGTVHITCSRDPKNSVSLEEAPGKDYIILENDNSIVVCHPKQPQILEYRLKGNKSRLEGQWDTKMPKFNIYCIEDKQPRTIFVCDLDNVEVIRNDYNKVLYRYQVLVSNKPAVDIEISIKLSKNEIIIRFEGCKEHDGYLLSNIEMGSVVSLNANLHETANMILPVDGGRLVNIHTASRGSTNHNMSARNCLLCEAVYDSYMLGVLYSDSVDDIVKSRVVDLPDGTRFGSMEVEFTHRYTKDVIRTGLLSQDSRSEETIRPGIVAQANSECKVFLLEDYLGDNIIDWQDAAAFIHDSINANVPEIYKNAYLNKIAIDYGPKDRKKQLVTFIEALDIVKRVYKYTGGAKQKYYLVGFQHHGHDTGYPDIFTVNERAGGYEKLLTLFQEAQKYNAEISFHDNYDDAYRHSPLWDEDILCRNKDGSLYEGWVWAGGQSYIISAGDYIQKGGLDRVNRTLDMYPISKSFHIDVLSCEVTRPNLDPMNPATSRQNVDAKLEIIKEFNKRGVDVNSEGLTAPFIGHIGFGSIVIGQSALYKTDTRIPFMPFIFHGKAMYGIHMAADSNNQFVLQRLKYGAMSFIDINENTSDEQLKFMYYLIMAPMFGLVDRKMTGYNCENGWETIRYEGENTYIKLNSVLERYCVVVNNQLISKDFVSMVKLPDNSGYALYSLYDENISFPLPKDFENLSCNDLKVYNIETEEEISLEVKEGNIIINIKAGIPVKFGKRKLTLKSC